MLLFKNNSYQFCALPVVVVVVVVVASLQLQLQLQLQLAGHMNRQIKSQTYVALSKEESELQSPRFKREVVTYGDTAKVIMYLCECVALACQL